MSQQMTPEAQPTLVAFTTKEGTPHQLKSDRTIVGSSSDADIQIRHSEVQDKHCLILKTETSFDIFDLTTDKSVRINGRPADAAPMTFGDELHLGQLRLVFADRKATVQPAGLQLAFGSPIPPSMLNEPNLDYLDAFRDVLRQAPWLAISCLLHGILFIVLNLITEDPAAEPPPMPTLSSEVDQTEGLTEEEEENLDEIAEEIEEEVKADELFNPDEEELVQPLLDAMDPTEGDEGSEQQPLSHGATLGDSGLGEGQGTGVGDSSLSLRNLGGDIRYRVQTLQASGLDIVILLDTTSSMQDEIDATRDQMSQMISLLETFGIDFRLSVIAFRDEGDTYVTRALPLTSRRFKAIDFMDSLSAEGGGDHPEGVLAAVKKASQLRYSRKAERVMILVGDAPPHDDEIAKTIQAIARFRKKSGHFHTVYAGSSFSRTYSGSDTQRVFADLAEAGGGQAVGSGSHSELIEDIIAVTLQINQRRTIQRMLRKSQEGVIARMMRRRIKKGDADYVVAQLSRPTMSSLLPGLLLQENAQSLIPAYMTVLRNPKLPIANRWLTHVLIQRQLRTVNRFQDIGSKTRRTLADFNPELSRSHQKRLLRDLSLSLEKHGIGTTLEK